MKHIERQESHEVSNAIDRLTRGAMDAPPSRREAPLSLRRVMAAIDDSEPSRQALAWTAEIGRAFGSNVDVVHVLPPAIPTTSFDFGYSMGEPAAHLETLAKQGQDLLDQAVAMLAKSDVLATRHMPTGHPTAEIARLVKAKKTDLVVLGSHGRNALGRLLLGSVADGVKHNVVASVLVAKGFPPPDRILVAADGSHASKRAAALGLRLRRAWGARTTILHVVDMPLYGPPESGRKVFEEAFKGLDPVWNDRKVEFDIEFGHPAERIIERARLETSGLIVMGSRGLSPLKTFTVGSVSSRVSHEAATSVLIVKEGPR